MGWIIVGVCLVTIAALVAMYQWIDRTNRKIVNQAFARTNVAGTLGFPVLQVIKWYQMPPEGPIPPVTCKVLFTDGADTYWYGYWNEVPPEAFATSKFWGELPNFPLATDVSHIEAQVDEMLENIGRAG